MTYPANLDTIVVRHKIVDTGGKPLKGNSVRAVATKRIWATDGSLIPFETTARVQADGTYEFELPYVDQDGIHNKGVPFQVTEDVPGNPRHYFIAPVLAHGAGPIDATEALVEAPVGYEVKIQAGPVTDESMAGFANDTTSQFHTAVAGIIASDPDVAQAAATRAVSVSSDAAMAGNADTDGSAFRQALTRTGNKPVGRDELVFSLNDHVPPNTATDQALAIQAVIDAATAAGGKVVGHGSWRIDQRITITCDADLGQVNLRYYGTGTAVRIGSKTDTANLFRPIITAPRVRNHSKTTLGWDGTSIGIDVWNVINGILTIPYVHDFTVGLRMFGYTTGTSYTTVTLGWLVNNRTNMLFDTDGTGGYANQNVVLGGRMSHTPAEGSNVPGVIDVRFQGAGDGGPNNNTFIGTSLEGATSQYAIDIDGGRFNRFLNCRLEYSNAVRFGPSSIHNSIEGGYHNLALTVVRESGSQLNVLSGRLGTEFTNHVRFRADGDPFEWVRFDRSNKRLYLGPGSSDPSVYLSAGAGGLILRGNLLTSGDGNRDIGSASTGWRDLYLFRHLRLGNIWLRDRDGDLEKSLDGVTWTPIA